MAASSTLRQSGPTLSIVHDNAIAPLRGTLPKVGRKPVTPQIVEGATIDPHVSDPMANGTSPAETAAPGPADEPLEPFAVSHGFLVCPPNQTSSIANSPRESFAHKTAPA